MPKHNWIERNGELVFLEYPNSYIVRKMKNKPVWVAHFPTDSVAKLPGRTYYFSTKEGAILACEKDYEGKL